jgi:Zn-dependent protease
MHEGGPRELSDVEREILARVQAGELELPEQRAGAEAEPAARGDAAPAKRGGLIGLLAAAAIAIWKFKAIFAALKFAKLAVYAKVFFVSGGTMLLAMWSWSLFFGWSFAAAFIIGAFVHEMGHVAAARYYRLPASAPMFIPFFGAFIALKRNPLTAKQDAVIGLAGPYFGAAFGYLCVLVYWLTGSLFWAALAELTLFINLFNLMPIYPLDGGRAVVGLSPWLWIVGMVLMVIAGAFWNPFLVLIVLMSLPTMVAIWQRKGPYARFLKIAPHDRMAIAFAYFGLAALLAYSMLRLTLALQAAADPSDPGFEWAE